MAVKVIMPKQGLQMTEGTITKWLFSEGDGVEAGNPLFEMETDKLNIEIDAPASGVLLKILRNEGETVPITETIAIIGEAGENITGLIINTPADGNISGTVQTPLASNTADVLKPADSGNAANANMDGGRIFITPRAKALAEEKGLNYGNIKGTGPEGLIIERDVSGYGKSEARITPVASKIAAIEDIKLEGVDGSGARGKITKADIEAVVGQRTAKPDSVPGKEKVIPFAGIRKVISGRMMQSLHNMAQANHRMKVDMSEIIRLREKLKEDNRKASITDILVKAVSKALLEFPILNSTLTDEGILLKDYVNMGIAVAVENGLIVPVIKNAHLMTLEEISLLSSELAAKAKTGSLKPDEYNRGTFTITNLGMFDIDEFTAIINPPESAILAVGKIDRVPVADGESVVIKPILMLSLTYDHRIIDGAPAAMFLQRIKQLLQNPYLLV